MDREVVLWNQINQQTSLLLQIVFTLKFWSVFVILLIFWISSCGSLFKSMVENILNQSRDILKWFGFKNFDDFYVWWVENNVVLIYCIILTIFTVISVFGLGDRIRTIVGLLAELIVVQAKHPIK